MSSTTGSCFHFRGWHFPWPYPPNQVGCTFYSFSCAVMTSSGISHLFRAYYVSEVTLGTLRVLTYFFFTTTVWGMYFYYPYIKDEKNEAKERWSSLPRVMIIHGPPRIWTAELDIGCCLLVATCPFSMGGGEWSLSPVMFLEGKAFIATVQVGSLQRSQDRRLRAAEVELFLVHQAISTLWALPSELCFSNIMQRLCIG